MPVKVASICPLKRDLAKPLFQPQRYWWMPAVKRGDAPFVIQFNDDIYQANDYLGLGNYGDRPQKAEWVANDFIASNIVLPFCHPPDMMPGLWIVGSLGHNEEFSVMGGSNASATMLQLDRAHGLEGSGDITISGALGFWAILNGVWRASPAGDNQVTVPVDSRSFGEFTNGGIQARVSIKRDLTLQQEAEIMRPRQDRWLARCLQDARFLWNREKNDFHIRDIHHIAANWFGIKGEPWQVKQDSSSTIQCRHCGNMVSKTVSHCGECGHITNPELAARLQMEEEAALKAARKKIKEADEAEVQRNWAQKRAEEAAANQEALIEQETIG
jgi:ribosomal protein L37E